MVKPVVWVLLSVAATGAACGQSSIGSLAEFRKKQSDGIAASVRASQERARPSSLSMSREKDKGPGGSKSRRTALPERPPAIRIGVRSTQTGFDNRRQTNMR